MASCSRASRWLALTLGVALAVALAACAERGVGDNGRPRVVASTAIIAEFAAAVAGDDIAVTTLIPPGIDVHSFVPTVRVARAIAAADLILINGYNLEGSLLDIIAQNRRAAATVVVVSRAVEPLGAGDGVRAPADGGEALWRARGDPHMWLDPANAVAYVEAIADALASVDPANRDGYAMRAATLIGELESLRVEIVAALDVIAPRRRKIVAFHDAFAYFARAFGFELVASVLPASPAAQASAGHVADVIAIVQREGVPALYREPQFASPLLELIAQEAGARVLVLYSTPATEAAGDYATMMRANAQSLIEGLAR